ncbi:MAG: hypothetical protein JWO73_342 [Candidatus Taylorbacteria bacterium]|nr:hypothetical protein [Candidatus Taylorbacteria bacterium]
METSSNRISASIIVSTGFKVFEIGKGMEFCVLLVLKNESDDPKKVAAGKWTFAGGKREGEESSKGCAQRENMQEVGFWITEKGLIRIGWIEGYATRGSTERLWNVAVYTTHHDEFLPEIILEPAELQEYRWFRFSEIPWDKMMSSDVRWLPKAIDMKEFHEIVYFDEL